MLQSLQNNDSRDCSICFNETNGLKMDYHTYLQYRPVWGYAAEKIEQ